MTLTTIPNCAKTLQVSEGRLRRAIENGQLPSMPLGNRMLVDTEEARAVLCRPEGVKIGVVAEQTGLTDTAIRRAIREGWMPCERIGKAYLFDMDAVFAAIKKRMQDQNTQK